MFNSFTTRKYKRKLLDSQGIPIGMSVSDSFNLTSTSRSYSGFSPNGKWFAYIDFNTTRLCVRSFDVDTGRFGPEIQGPLCSRSLKWHPSGRYVGIVEGGPVMNMYRINFQDTSF